MSGPMLVGQIESVVQRDESRVQTTLGQVTVADGGHRITVVDANDVERVYEFDEVTERTLSSFLDVNSSYMSKCPPELKALNLNHWLRKNAETQAQIMVGPKGIETIHDPDTTVITVPEVAGVISRVFQPNDEIVTLISDPTKFHADVKIDSNIIVPGNGLADRPGADGLLRRPGTTDEPARVFDITHGGVRFLAHPTKSQAPTVERYFNRLICANGMTMPVPDRKITLRGNTVADVLKEMEDIAGELMGTMDDALAKYAELAEIGVPGNALNYIRQIGKEAGISDRIINQALDYAGASNFGSGGVDVTQYDVMNLFTGLANNDSVRYSTGLKLQSLGGIFVAQGREMTHRCTSCERLLPHLD